MQNKLFINPFALYSISFGIVLLLYGFEWSAVYPKLSANLLSFIVTTIVVMMAIGYLFYRKNYFEYRPVATNEKKLGRKILFCYILLIIEFVQARSIPLFSMIAGQGADYTEFGLPFIHVFFAAYMGFLSIYIFHCLLSRGKGERKRLVWFLILVVLPGILIVNRAMVMTTLIGWAIIYMMSVKRLSGIILRTSLLALVVFYLFGLMGNYRINGRGDSEAIMVMGKATEEFKENLVPGEFFWTYLYMASPMGNLQYTINNKSDRIDEDGLQKLIIFELLPEMMSKRIAPVIDIQREKVDLVLPALNAYSVYAAAFVYGGWWGMWLMFGFSVFFIFVNLILIPRNSPYFITGMAILSTVMILNIFNNFFSFMNLVSQLFVVNLLSFPYLIREIKKHRKIK